MRTIVLTAALLAGVFTPLRSAFAQPYNYFGPIVARDSALSCFGKTLADENQVRRDTLHGLSNNSKTRAITVLCPLNRRNVTNYGNDGETDSVLIGLANIFVQNASTSAPIKCQLFLWLASSNASRTTALVSAPGTGFTTISFGNTPLGTTTFVNQGIASIGYQCTLPKDGVGKNFLIGGEAFFDPT